MLETLKEKVYEANMLLPKYDLVTFTWGNVSGISQDRSFIVIKPSGVPYDLLSPEKMVVVDISNGKIVEGNLKPSSDTPTHIELYKAFPKIQGVVHTHSPWAVSFAQAGAPIPASGTTHADYFYGEIPVSRKMRADEIEQDYEKNTGLVISETFQVNKIDSNDVPGVLVNDHGPFTWGISPEDAVHHSVVLEQVAMMTYRTQNINPNQIEIDQKLLDKHYLRKHGKNAYYGQ